MLMSWAVHACSQTYARETNTEVEHLPGASVKSIKRYSKARLPVQLPAPSHQGQGLGCGMGSEGKCHVFRFRLGWASRSPFTLGIPEFSWEPVSGADFMCLRRFPCLDITSVSESPGDSRAPVTPHRGQLGKQETVESRASEAEHLILFI